MAARALLQAPRPAVLDHAGSAKRRSARVKLAETRAPATAARPRGRAYDRFDRGASGEHPIQRPGVGSTAYPAHIMASRPLHDSARIAAPALEKMRANNADTIREIEDAIAAHDVVVVGMAQNPHVKNVRKALDEAGVKFQYLEYGSYFSEWKKRLAIKLWSGWPTFPQVYVKGELIGGEDLTKEAITRGDLKPYAK
jgi:glutaredoxin-related protein